MKTTKLYTLTFVAAAAMGFTSTTYAADAAKTPPVAAAAKPAAAGETTGGHGKKQFVTSYDTNQDATVSRAEFDAQRKTDFARTNTDGKGDVTETEYVGEYQVRLEKDLADMRERQLKQAHVRFGVLDANKDARLTQAEYDASGDRIFKKLDSNGDGLIDEKDSIEAY